jgi:hypothetical protein
MPKLIGDFDTTVEIRTDEDGLEEMVISTDKGSVTLFYDQWVQVVAFQKTFAPTWSNE